MHKPPSILEFERNVAQEVLVQGLKRMEGRLYVTMGFYVRKDRDIDNMATSVLDALQRAGVFDNDKEVVELHLSKYHTEGNDPPYASITITSDNTIT